MTMPPTVRKVALTVHVLSSVGWLGAIAAFLVLAVLGLVDSDAQVVRAAYVVLEPITWSVLVPLSLAALLTGLVQSLGTNWGLVRHYWVLIKLAVTALAVVVLLLQLGAIGELSDAALRQALSADDLRAGRISLVVHSGGGLIVLLVPLVLSVYKPRGRTRFHQQRRPTARSRRISGADIDIKITR